jgi:hypothetical protein
MQSGSSSERHSLRCFAVQSLAFRKKVFRYFRYPETRALDYDNRLQNTSTFNFSFGISYNII